MSQRFSLERYADLILTLTQKEIKIRYKSNLLGYFWSLANPLASAVVFYLAIQVFLRVEIDKQRALACLLKRVREIHGKCGFADPALDAVRRDNPHQAAVFSVKTADVAGMHRDKTGTWQRPVGPAHLFPEIDAHTATWLLSSIRSFIRPPKSLGRARPKAS